VLKEAELVTERRDGTRRLYRANTDTMAELRRAFPRRVLDLRPRGGCATWLRPPEARQATDDEKEQPDMAELVRRRRS